MNTDFRVVTVCNRFPTEPYYCLNEWFKSLGGHQPVVIGGLQNKFYQGLGDKPKFVYAAIKSGLIKEKYIIFCDSWDLVFATPLQDIIEKFHGFDADLVISAEKSCFPNDLKEEYDSLGSHILSPYKYLNSGMIVGRVDAMLTTLDAMDLGNVPDDFRNEDGSMTHINDQYLYQQIFLKQPVNIKLDYNQAICNTLHGVTIDELDFSESGIFNKTTEEYPCSFHMNGSAKTDGLREPILKHLNL